MDEIVNYVHDELLQSDLHAIHKQSEVTTDLWKAAKYGTANTPICALSILN
jgi:hypothetical protein